VWPAVQNILLPQLRQMSADEGIVDFFANVTRNVQGSFFNGLVATLSPAAVEFISGLPIVTLVEPDITLHFLQSTAASPSAPPAPAFTQADAPWHLDRIDSRAKAYDDKYHYTQTGEGVDVYIIDSGINTAHTEFTGRIQPGANFQDDQAGNDVEDCNGHGTHVAGLAAGTTYGAAKKANIIPVRIYGCDNSGPLSQALEGINFVLQRMTGSGRRSVINMSFGGESSPALDAAVRSLTAAGGVVVVAAGNEAADACSTSPAGASEAFAVAASDKSDNFADFSNYGPCVSLVAPGKNRDAVPSHE
jgi:subtilisin family serine protease